MLQQYEQRKHLTPDSSGRLSGALCGKEKGEMKNENEERIY
jgi:hypothetical protein